MTKRHLIYGDFGNHRLVGHVIPAALAVIAVGMICFEELRAPGLGLLIISAALAGAVEVYAAVMRRRQKWIEVQPASFKVIDRTGVREWQDYEIVSFAFSTTPIISNGHPAGFRRRCRLWPAPGVPGKDPGPPIELTNNFRQGQRDPLQEFIERIGDLLRDGFAQALEEGVEVRGDGWSLGKTMLRCRVGGREEQLPIHQIAAVHPYDQFMGVWLVDKEDPVVSLPLDGRNVWLLPALLAPYLPPRDPDVPPPAGGLGRLIFRRKASLAMVITVSVLAAALTGCGIAGGIAGEKDAQFILFGLGGGGLVLAAVTAHLAWAEFRCQEWGVVKRNLFGRKQLLYRDVKTFTYQAVRHYTNGAYTGTNLLLRFVPLPGCGSVIAHSAHVHGDDAALDHLRDEISQIIASQMHHRLAADEEVPWTKNLAFSPEGLVYRPASFVTRGQPTLLPYEAYAGYNLNDGYFFLFEKGKDKPVLSENVGEENFFPGFCLLLNLAHASAAEEPA